jgi:LmbE family N-acetylglucosaminyl deacetylase
MNIEPKAVLAIAPHPDDIELGMGATLRKFLRSDISVDVVVLSSAEQSLPQGYSAIDIIKECVESLEVLGMQSQDIQFYDFPVRRFNEKRQDLLELLVKIDRQKEYDLVFCPSLSDTHQDHEVVANECVRAFRKRTLIGYELPWNNRGFIPTLSVMVTEEDIDYKELSLSKYKSQYGRPYFEAGLLKSLARLRASVTGYEFVESFEVIRMVAK